MSLDRPKCLTFAISLDNIPSDMIYQLENEIRQSCPDRLTWQKTIPTFHPESAEEAAEIFRRAGQYGQKIFIAGFGNNVDPVGDTFADLLVIKTDRLNYIDLTAARDFSITVGAGYPLIEINHAIAQDKLWFPFSQTNYPGSAGGALACGLAGSDGSHQVPLSRFLLAVTAVLPDGSLVKPGALTFKSVSGYDVSRIFFNSWGSLGLIVELSFRVLPISKRGEWPRIPLFPVDREGFVDTLQGNTPESHLCRRLKDEFDPDRLLPLV